MTTALYIIRRTWMSLKAVVNIVIKSSYPIAFTFFRVIMFTMQYSQNALTIIRCAQGGLIHRLLMTNY